MSYKFILFLIFVGFNSISISQMKRSCFGTYIGKIEGYSLGKSNELIQIDPTAIKIQILKGAIFVFIDDQTYEGTWQVLLETKKYYLVEASTNSKAPERLMVYKKERKILREGISPQPNVTLKKRANNFFK